MCPGALHIGLVCLVREHSDGAGEVVRFCMVAMANARFERLIAFSGAGGTFGLTRNAWIASMLLTRAMPFDDRASQMQ